MIRFRLIYLLSIVAAKVLYMKYRSRTEIFATILSSAVGKRDILPIRLMYTVYLPYDQSKEYFGILGKNGLLRQDKRLKNIEQQRKD